MKKINLERFFSSLAIATLSALVLSACSNSSRSFPTPKTSSKSTAITSSNSVTQTSASFTISSVQNTMSNPSQLPNYNIFFTPATGTEPVIINYCNTSTLTCECVFSWTENVQGGNNPTTYTRTAKTTVKLVQTNLVNCDAPQPFGNGLEVPVGTQIQIKVQPSANNTNLFSTNGYLYTRPALSGLGNAFQDAAGNSFFDIYRYSCYEINQKKSMRIGQTIVPMTNPSGGPGLDYINTTSYCLRGDQCTIGTPVGQQVSVQSNYHNLFIRSTELGSINAESSTYKCPIVSGTSTLQSSISGASNPAPNYWPLDTSFALALARSNDFTVGVEAFTKLQGPGDLPSMQPGGACNPVPSPSATSGGGLDQNIQNNAPGLIRGCLGFAAKPNVDGSCKPILVNGQYRPTFRLRRYVAIHPPQFQADGQLTDKPQTVDTIYVVDRPLAVGVGYDPSTPRPSVRGPKPCPYSYLDVNGILNNGTKKYVSTTSSSWSGVNPDGTEFPNVDDRDNALGKGKSARSTLAILNRDDLIKNPGSTAGFFFKTLNYDPADTSKQEHVYIRPMKPWGPVYHEDTDFFACAPLSSTVTDPPIQYEKVGTTATWCSKVYPSHNENLPKDAPIATRQACTSTTNCTSVSSGLKRTVTATNGNWPNFPLLAPEADIHTFLTNQKSSFACDVTWPTSGTTLSTQCCVGAAATSVAHGGDTSYHFEPSSTQKACKPPQ